jgi:2-dehydro-3-deoxyphosphogluconate aldolase/(4S)-4-hydroxy-2-oxoglutarate aldolase
MIGHALRHIERHGIIAIVRGNFPLDRLIAIGETLASAKLPIIEVTLNSAGALDAIGELRERLGDDVLVGVGTVRTAVQLQEALDAGAQFSVAPNFDITTVEVAQANQFLHLPGVFTPSEAQMAYAAGCRLLKLFPADAVGPRYIKALRAPLDNIDFVATGGVSSENVGLYRHAGAFAVGVGGALVSGPDQSMDDLARRARAFRRAWDEASSEAAP